MVALFDDQLLVVNPDGSLARLGTGEREMIGGRQPFRLARLKLHEHVFQEIVNRPWMQAPMDMAGCLVGKTPGDILGSIRTRNDIDVFLFLLQRSNRFFQVGLAVVQPG